MSAPVAGQAEGMTRQDAEALVREVSTAPGFRGALHRLADGGPPDGPGWAVRVTALLSGGGGLVRSREAWERYRSRQRQEVRSMVAVAPQAGPQREHQANGVVVGPPEDPPFLGSPAPEAPQPAPAPKREPVLSALERWRRLTEEAIAETERTAERKLAQADRLRDEAGRERQEARRLRRALLLVAPAEDEGGDGSIRGRVLGWTRAHGGELVLSPCADELGLSIKRASDAASQLKSDGRLERVGKGRYRLLEGAAVE